MIGHFARSGGKRAYLIDTFSGFAKEQIEVTLSDNAKGVFRDTSLKYKQATVGTDPLSYWIVGAFPDAITPELKEERFSFVSLDCDMYEPTLAGHRFFYPRLLVRALARRDARRRRVHERD